MPVERDAGGLRALPPGKSFSAALNIAGSRSAIGAECLR